MTRIRIEDAGKHVGEEVTLCGWVHNKRSSGKIQFLIVRDGSGYIQGVLVRNSVPADVFEAAESLTHESSVIVTGKIREDSRAPSGFEMDLTGVQPVQIVSKDDPFPITPKEHGIEFLMDQRHLWIRSTRQHAILKVRHEIIKAVRDFFDDNGFTLCDTPILTPAACEGTSTLFEVKYFEEMAFLTQSGQLYGEATAAALGRVYNFGPTFRAEKSKTRRHLTEFWMVEPEVAYATVDDIMDLAEQMISFVIQRVVSKRAAELKVLERDISKLEKIVPPFPRISYDDAVHILQKNGSEIQWGSDFGGGDETIISQQFDKPVLVHRYPTAIKAFYMEPDPARPDVALCVDVLAPEGYGEIIGGGQRMSSYELLVQRIEEHGLPREAFEWYLDLRKYGSVPHAGFGMGIERAVTWICGLEHVRETIPFSKDAVQVNAMNLSRISIIGVPMDLGADRRGVDMGPSALRYSNLNQHLTELGCEVQDLGDIDVMIPETQHFGDPHAKYLQEIADACQQLARMTLETYESGRTPLVLGGDHSIAVGTISGMSEAFRRKNKRLGLLWFDAHADMNTPEISPSGNVHGMPMAAILGYGPRALTHIYDFSPKIQPERVVMIGIREVDKEERELVKRSGVRVFTMKEIDKRGIGNVMDEALSIVTANTDGFSVTLDADFLDPFDTPGVATPVRGGADYREAHLAMEMVADTRQMASFEITEINPILDVHNKTANVGMELVLSAFGKQIL